ncbi:MAG: MmgE/PrpD family protein, partial [Dehalobacterium sp.]
MLSEKISRYVAESKYRDFPKEVQEKVKECFIDWLGCSFAGSTLEPVHILLKIFTEEKVTGNCRVVGCLT